MTSMYTTPQTYAAAPAMTSMYATQGASMYMPAQTVVAAPTVVETVAAPVAQVTQAAPSYVAAPVETVAAAPVVTAAPVVETVLPGFAVPQPAKLTAGLVDPKTLEAEKAAYGKALQLQLKKQSDAILEEARIKKEMLS